MVREEAEKAQRRQLAVEQWTLAKRHHLRALDNLSIFRTKAIKAKHWHHDTTLHQRFGAWVGYRDVCRAQARAIRTARLRAAATWHGKRWLNRVMFQWQAQLCRLQVKREADAKRRVLHVWSCRVGVRRKEAAAKREKDRMWRQCTSTYGCNFYVWTDYNSGTCWLKSKQGSDKVLSFGSRAAFAPGGGVASTCSPVEVNTDYAGVDIVGVAGPLDTCCDACKANYKCIHRSNFKVSFRD
ncbi:hypothetical protein DYB26_006901 [Aphanomyces astaci]|uniref:Apple domain-containing protein n=1 Tax=Aphanomyces astaci TaxID=112090 RepID=A0A3R7BUA9_APHAT|nr:hypothetical protein DYB26_006901 [Aphanomyces astaci]